MTTKKIDEVIHDHKKYGNLSYEEMSRAYFCKRLNISMNNYENSIKRMSKHILQAIDSLEIRKELNRERDESNKIVSRSNARTIKRTFS